MSKNNVKARIANNKGNRTRHNPTVIGKTSTAGITLIALVVTIVVLIILATISINAVLGENGIIKKAEKAKGVYENSVIAEDKAMNTLFAEYENAMTGGNGGDTPIDPTPTYPTGPNGKQLVSSVTTTEHDTIIGEDDKGNQVVVPGGFKVAPDSGTNVQDGVVIEDGSGNQFVWIPVSNINHDGSNLITLKDGSTKEITLGRYTFDATTGAETKQQYGSEYTQTVTVESYYQELTEFRESNQVSDATGTNATAKDLKGFIESVRDNKGYYMARYEASYASGSEFGVGNDSKYYKPASKVSTANSESAMNYTAGTLWNFITQGNASKASRQMYYGNSYVESDLINSYAWDTAIVYIQAMGNDNYANANYNTTGSTTLKNTGETGDQKCKIFDMATNLDEWTTEYSTFTFTIHASRCAHRGGYAYSIYDTGARNYDGAADSSKVTSFRPLLYVKQL